ncbi:MAG: polyprenyl synthetase family protein, partial [Anaerolineales bacterium]|nr:polyprenyl synthetase family protein [Anaerolineales bacterium]
MSLNQLSTSTLPAIETELRNVVGSGPAELHAYYLMMRYHMGWVNEKDAPLDDPHATGKRIRPLLCVLACQAAGGEWETALPMAAAIELLHNFSLLHDDIQDNSPLRRGR